MADFNRIKHFKPAEFRCKCGCGKGAEEMQQNVVDSLDRIREDLGFPLFLNSAYRCPKYNKSIGGGPAHMVGSAVDVAVSGVQAYQFLAKALAEGFSGIGPKQTGAHSGRFIHVDKYSGPDAPRPWVWGYT